MKLPSTANAAWKQVLAKWHMEFEGLRKVALGELGR